MNPVDRYIHDVLSRVFAAPSDRERLAADLRSHFAEAEAAGEAPARVIESMGTPADVAAVFNAERPMVYGGFWRRLVAFIADFGALLLLTLPPIAFAVLAAARLDATGSGPEDLVVLLPLLGFGCAAFGLIVLYFPLLEWRFGMTLGKRLMGLHVVRENGSPIGLGQAFVRWLSLYFELLVVDALFIPFTEKKQRALDIIAKTVVVREPWREVGVVSWLVALLLPLIGMCALALVAVLCVPA